jgi:hypothetical protein
MTAETVQGNAAGELVLRPRAVPQGAGSHLAAGLALRRARGGLAGGRRLPPPGHRRRADPRHAGGGRNAARLPQQLPPPRFDTLRNRFRPLQERADRLPLPRLELPAERRTGARPAQHRQRRPAPGGFSAVPRGPGPLARLRVRQPGRESRPDARSGAGRGGGARGGVAAGGLAPGAPRDPPAGLQLEDLLGKLPRVLPLPGGPPRAGPPGAGLPQWLHGIRRRRAATGPGGQARCCGRAR